MDPDVGGRQYREGVAAPEEIHMNETPIAVSRLGEND